MPGGRPKNRKNARGHAAGGRRKGAGRKKKQEGTDPTASSHESRKPRNEEEEEAHRKKEAERLKHERLEKLIATFKANQKKIIDIATVDQNEDVEDSISFYLDDTDDASANEKASYAGFIPAYDSYIGKEMSKLLTKLDLGKEKRKIADPLKLISYRRQFWHYDAIDGAVAFAASSNESTPKRFYQGNFCAFAWLPTYQFDAVNMSNICCWKCSNTGSVSLNEIKFRPMIYFDRICWLLHHTIKCGECGKCSSTIDSKFLSQLPTTVVDRFQFVAPIRGPGVHISMVRQFCHLAGKQIMFGTYVDNINEMLTVKYYQDMATYYDMVAERISKEDGYYESRNYEVRFVYALHYLRF